MFAPIRREPLAHTMFTDVCKDGWGAHFKGQTAQGKFTFEESQWTINTKETLAVLFGIQSFQHQLRDTHVLIRSDNTTTVSNIRDQGTMNNMLRDRYVRDIWHLTYQMNTWLSISWITRVENVKADDASHIFKTTTEWTLPQRMFTQLNKHAGPFDMDLMAS